MTSRRKNSSSLDKTETFASSLDRIVADAESDPHAARSPRVQTRRSFGPDFESYYDSESEEEDEDTPDEIISSAYTNVDDISTAIESANDDDCQHDVSNSSNKRKGLSGAVLSLEWQKICTLVQPELCKAGNWQSRVNPRLSTLDVNGNSTDMLRYTELQWYMCFRTDANRLAEIHTINLHVANLLNESERPAYISPKLAWPPKLLKDWYMLMLPEYCIFEGMLLVEGFLGLPTHRDYFRSDWPYCGVFRGLLSRNRFKAILSCLHFVPELRSPAGADALYKVQPLLDRLRANVQSVYRMGRECSADEGVISCESKKISRSIRYSKLPKPIGEGIVVEVMAEAKDDTDVIVPGYIADFEIRKKGEPILSRWMRMMERNSDVCKLLHIHIYFYHIFLFIYVLDQLPAHGL